MVSILLRAFLCERNMDFNNVRTAIWNASASVPAEVPTMTVGPRNGKLRESVPTTFVIQGVFNGNGLFTEVQNAEELHAYLNKYSVEAAKTLGMPPPATTALQSGQVPYEIFGNVEVYDKNFRLKQTHPPLCSCYVRARLQPWARKCKNNIVVTLVLRALQVECIDELL